MCLLMLFLSQQMKQNSQTPLIAHLQNFTVIPLLLYGHEKTRARAMCSTLEDAPIYTVLSL